MADRLAANGCVGGALPPGCRCRMLEASGIRSDAGCTRGAVGFPAGARIRPWPWSRHYLVTQVEYRKRPVEQR